MQFKSQAERYRVCVLYRLQFAVDRCRRFGRNWLEFLSTRFEKNWSVTLRQSHHMIHDTATVYIKSICVHSHRPSAPNKLIDFMQTMGRSVGEKLPKTLLNDGSEFNCVSPIRNMHIPSRIMFRSTRLSQPNHAIRYEHSTNELHRFKGQKPETNHTHIQASGRALAHISILDFFLDKLTIQNPFETGRKGKKRCKTREKKTMGKMSIVLFAFLTDTHTVWQQHIDV